MALIACMANAAPVYKCEKGGKVAYSDEPCVGASVVDVTPTQGMDKWTDKSRKGADVQRKEWNDLFANAVKPLTGKTPEQFEKDGRRYQLGTNAYAECNMLDYQLPQLEKSMRQGADIALYQARKRFKELKC